jgi:hypothetical protein
VLEDLLERLVQILVLGSTLADVREELAGKASSIASNARACRPIAFSTRSGLGVVPAHVVSGEVALNRESLVGTVRT